MLRISHWQNGRALGNICQEKATPGHGVLPLKTLFKVTSQLESNKPSLGTVRKPKNRNKHTHTSSDITTVHILDFFLLRSVFPLLWTELCAPRIHMLKP